MRAFTAATLRNCTAEHPTPSHRRTLRYTKRHTREPGITPAPANSEQLEENLKVQLRHAAY
jgi:hypothetical protein